MTEGTELETALGDDLVREFALPRMEQSMRLDAVLSKGFLEPSNTLFALESQLELERKRAVGAELTVAVAQPACVARDIAANVAFHAALVPAADARVVVFPELSLTGYDLDAAAVEVTASVLDPLVEACAQSGAIALVGAPVSEGGRRFIAVLACRVPTRGLRIARRGLVVMRLQYSRPVLVRSRLILTGGGSVSGCARTPVSRSTWTVWSVSASTSTPRGSFITRMRSASSIAFASAAGGVGRHYPDAAGHSGIWDRSGKIMARADGQPGQVSRAVVRR